MELVEHFPNISRTLTSKRGIGIFLKFRQLKETRASLRPRAPSIMIIISHPSHASFHHFPSLRAICCGATDLAEITSISIFIRINFARSIFTPATYTVEPCLDNVIILANVTLPFAAKSWKISIAVFYSPCRKRNIDRKKNDRDDNTGVVLSPQYGQRLYLLQSFVNCMQILYRLSAHNAIATRSLREQ